MLFFCIILGNITCNMNSSDKNSEYIKYPDRPTLAYPMFLSYIFIFASLIVGVFIRAIMLITCTCVPYTVIMFSLGGVVGFFANQYPTIRPIVSVCYNDVEIFLLTFLPILVYNTSYHVDAHSFWKSLPQIFLIAIPGTLLSSSLVAFMAYNVIEGSWNFTTALLFGIVCSPIYPVDLVQTLREKSKAKNVSIVLQGEGMIGDATAMITFTVLFGMLSMALSKASQVILLLTRYIGGGIILGIIMGKLISTTLSFTYYDIHCAVIITLAGAYITFYLGEKLLYVSGLLGTIITGVIVSNMKSSLSAEVEQVIAKFWLVLAHIANTLVFTMVGVLIFDRAFHVITIRQVSLTFVTYCTVFCARLLVYATLTPILRHVGYGMTWQHSMACVWGGLRGPLTLMLALIVLETPGVGDTGEVSFFY